MNFFKRLFGKKKKEDTPFQQRNWSGYVGGGNYNRQSDDSSLMNPANIISPLNPLSPFWIGNSNNDYSPHQQDNNNYEPPTHNDSPSHDYNSPSDSSSYDSGSSSDSSSYDSGSSSDSSSSSSDF